MSLSYQLLGEAAIVFEGMTNEERATIADPPTYLTILNESTGHLEMYADEEWQVFARVYPAPVVSGDAPLWDADTSRFVPSAQATKGFLLPSLSTAERNALVNPALGLQVHDVDTLSPAFYGAGGQWHSLWERTRNAADFSGVQAAINDLPSGGGTVILPTGYSESFATGITLPAGGDITIRAEQPGTATLTYTGTGTGISSSNTAGNYSPWITLSGFNLTCSNAAVTGGIKLHRCPWFLIDRVELHGPDDSNDDSSIGILIDGNYEGTSVSRSSWYGRIRQCSVRLWFRGVRFAGGSGNNPGRANENRIEGGFYQNNVIGIDVDNGHNVVVDNPTLLWNRTSEGEYPQTARNGTNYDVIGVRVASLATRLLFPYIEGPGYCIDADTSEGDPTGTSSNRLTVFSPMLGPYDGVDNTGLRFSRAAINVSYYGCYGNDCATKVSGTAGTGLNFVGEYGTAYGNAASQLSTNTRYKYVLRLFNDEDTEAHVLHLETDGTGAGSKVLTADNASGTILEFDAGGTLRVDTLAEMTSGAGITAEDVLLKDGHVKVTAAAHDEATLAFAGDYRQKIAYDSGYFLAIQTQDTGGAGSLVDRLIWRSNADIADIEITDAARLQIECATGDNITGVIDYEEKDQDPGAGNYPGSGRWYLYAKAGGFYQQDDAGAVIGPFITTPLTTQGDLWVRDGSGDARLALSVPAANVRNVLGVDNGETDPSWKAALDATNPADIANAASPGTALLFAHRDHVHAHPAGLTASLHHTKYTDAEAIAAVEGEATLDLGGDVTVAAGKSLQVEASAHDQATLKFAGDYRHKIAYDSGYFLAIQTRDAGGAGSLVDRMQFRTGAAVADIDVATNTVLDITDVTGFKAGYGTAAPTHTRDGQLSVAVVGGTNRIYFYSNAGQHYVDATVGFGFPERECYLCGKRMAVGDVLVMVIDEDRADEFHALPAHASCARSN